MPQFKFYVTQCSTFIVEANSAEEAAELARKNEAVKLDEKLFEPNIDEIEEVQS